MGKHLMEELQFVVPAAVIACTSLASPSKEGVIMCRYILVASELVLEALILYT